MYLNNFPALFPSTRKDCLDSIVLSCSLCQILIEHNSLGWFLGSPCPASHPCLFCPQALQVNAFLSTAMPCYVVVNENFCSLGLRFKKAIYIVALSSTGFGLPHPDSVAASSFVVFHSWLDDTDSMAPTAPAQRHWCHCYCKQVGMLLEQFSP